MVNNKMTAKDYAEYTIDNMHRASLANALSITKHFIEVKRNGEVIQEPEYDIIEFLNCMDSYVSELITQGRMDRIKAYSIIIIIDKCRKRVTNPSFNRNMCIDDLIIELWEAYQ